MQVARATFIAARIFQPREPLWCQLQQVIAPSCFTTYQVNLQVSHLQAHRFILWNCGSAQGFSSCQRFRESEWLSEVVVSTLLSPAHAHPQNAGQTRLKLAPNYLGLGSARVSPTRLVWEAKIDDEGIMNTFQGHGLPAFRVTRRIHLVSGLHQRPFQELLNGASSSTKSNRIEGFPPFQHYHPQVGCRKLLNV